MGSEGNRDAIRPRCFADTDGAVAKINWKRGKSNGPPLRVSFAGEVRGIIRRKRKGEEEGDMNAQQEEVEPGVDRPVGDQR